MSDIIELRVYPGFNFGEIEARFDGLVRLMKKDMDEVCGWRTDLYITRSNAEKLVKELQDSLRLCK